MAFNELAKATMALEADRLAREEEYFKQIDWEDAKNNLEWYERRIADLEGRLTDFDAFGGEMDSSMLPPCGPEWYMDDYGIPQMDP